jgi:heme exporter protein B
MARYVGRDRGACAVMQRTALIALRELFAERRNPDGLVSALTFTGMIVLLESLAFGPGRAREPDVASGVFWIALLFAAVLVSQRSFDRELEDDAIDPIIALDGGREALFAGKVLALTILVALVAVASGTFAILLLDLYVALAGHLALVVFCGVLALPPVVALTNVLALRVRARIALVPILAFPMLVPQLVSATQGASAALSGDAAAALGWAGLLAAFALVYAVLGLTIVPAAIE